MSGTLDTWKWYTGPLTLQQSCARCFRPLRLHDGAGAHTIEWRDGRLYAVGCLLDKLVAAPPTDARAAPLDPYTDAYAKAFGNVP